MEAKHAQVCCVSGICSSISVPIIPYKTKIWSVVYQLIDTDASTHFDHMSCDCTLDGLVSLFRVILVLLTRSLFPLARVITSNVGREEIKT